MHQREMSLAPISVGCRNVTPSAIAVAAVITNRAVNRARPDVLVLALIRSSPVLILQRVVLVTTGFQGIKILLK